MKRWPELHQRLLDLAEALEEHGISWEPFGLGATVRRGSRVPPEVVAEMKRLLERLRALLPQTTTEGDVDWFAEGCRLLAQQYPDKRTELEALAERARRERTTFCEQRERLVAAAAREPVWGPIRFLEPGESAGPLFSSLPGDASPRRDYPSVPLEPTVEMGFKALWRLVLAWESGALEAKQER